MCRLVTIAAPWRFAGHGEQARAAADRLWTAARPVADTLGVLPMEVLQTAFWTLDPRRTIAKYAAFALMDAARAAQFVLLEDWANAGALLTYAAGADLFETLLRADAPEGGMWEVGDRTIEATGLACPAVQYVSLIVPAATAFPTLDRCDLAAGHVGMVVGGAALEIGRAHV